ncbi:putative hydrolase [Plesiocystis pacifica SIR-1]|uniref:Putative hydrolase n=1 Tax=Plesiocystis pacifica SIR-1 TaxID=391625 RepID=A6GA12_9BACT|nr:alpha/beta hydrolase [Plesiocystis pacifica]EDM77337.1 putative hydrolase [Plesiocystis pacifica SIR-1]
MPSFTERVFGLAVSHALSGEPDRWLDLGHARLPYWKIGSGPDLALIHGWPVDGQTWRRIVPILAEHFTCHVIDLPGAGRSTWTDATPRGCAGLTSSLAQAIEKMDLAERFGFVAFDSGGGFARKVAADMPERIVGLALGNTETPKDYSGLFRAALRNGRRRGAKPAMFLGLQLRAMREKAWETSATDPALRRELAELFVRPLARDRRRFAGVFVLADGLSAEDFDGCYEAHQKITAPVRLIWGTDDPWFELDAAKRMVEQFAGPASLVEIEGGKLFVHEEFPKAFAEQVVDHFLAAFAPS